MSSVPVSLTNVCVQGNTSARPFQEKLTSSCKRNLSVSFPKLTTDDAECPDSPTPSIISESSAEGPSAKKRLKHTKKKVTFDLTNIEDVTKACKDHYKLNNGNDARTAMWWSEMEMMGIMKREGTFVLNLKISKAGGLRPLSCSLKQTINETFKKCVDSPVALNTGVSLVVSLNDSAGVEKKESNKSLVDTRGLERYVAPIMSAHRQMVVKSLLNTQSKLANQDRNYRAKVIGERYEHMSRVAANFALVMGKLDAEVAAATC